MDEIYADVLVRSSAHHDVKLKPVWRPGDSQQDLLTAKGNSRI